MATAGEQGIAIVPRTREGVRAFWLQARPFASSTIEKLSAVDPASSEDKWPSLEKIVGKPIPFVTMMSLPLKFCPSCGVALQRIIEEDFEAFDDDENSSTYLWEEVKGVEDGQEGQRID